MARRSDYLTKKEFYNELGNFKNDGKIDRLMKYVETLIEKIQSKSKFNRYPFVDLDEMKQEATIACWLAFKKFDLTHENKNPFAYFTTVIFNVFKLYLKTEYYGNANFILELIEEHCHDEGLPFENVRKKVVEDCKRAKTMKY
jgi:DNA-directed RNA polymerase specialized sigma24 family protein